MFSRPRPNQNFQQGASVEFTTDSGRVEYKDSLSDYLKSYYDEDSPLFQGTDPEILRYVELSRHCYEGSKLWVLPEKDVLKNEELAKNYLVRGRGEDLADWRDRVKRSPFPTFYKQAINSYIGILSLYREIDLPESITEVKNIDRKGNNLRLFLKECDRQALLDGWVGVLVEFPSEEEVRTGDTSPYLIKVNRDALTSDPVFDEYGNLIRIAYVLTATEFDEEGNPEEKEKYWVLTTESYLEYEKTEKGYILVEEKDVRQKSKPLKSLPFVFYPYTGANPSEVQPPFLEIALDNFHLYNMISEHRWNMYLSSQVVFVRKGLLRGDNTDGYRQESLPALKIGNHAVDVPPDGGLEAVETSGKASEARRQEIEDLKFSIQQQTLSPLRGATGQMTDDEVQLRGLPVQATLAGLATAKVSAFEQILEHWAFWLGENYSDSSIEFDSSVLQVPITPREKEQLREDVLNGMLSIETYWKIIAARGGLPQSVSIEDVLEGLNNGEI